MVSAGALAWEAEGPGLDQPGEEAVTGGPKSHLPMVIFCLVLFVCLVICFLFVCVFLNFFSFPMRTSRQWSRLPREAVPALPMQVFKTSLDQALGSLVSPLSLSRMLDQRPPKVAPNLICPVNP